MLRVAVRYRPDLFVVLSLDKNPVMALGCVRDCEPFGYGVLIGDVPSWRVDHMPYGGVKDSGLGREGIRFAIEDMTEIRLLVIRTP